MLSDAEPFFGDRAVAFPTKRAKGLNGVIEEEVLMKKGFDHQFVAFKERIGLVSVYLGGAGVVEGTRYAFDIELLVDFKINVNFKGSETTRALYNGAGTE